MSDGRKSANSLSHVLGESVLVFVDIPVILFQSIKLREKLNIAE